MTVFLFCSAWWEDWEQTWCETGGLGVKRRLMKSFVEPALRCSVRPPTRGGGGKMCVCVCSHPTRTPTLHRTHCALTLLLHSVSGSSPPHRCHNGDKSRRHHASRLKAPPLPKTTPHPLLFSAALHPHPFLPSLNLPPGTSLLSAVALYPTVKKQISPLTA